MSYSMTSIPYVDEVYSVSSSESVLSSRNDSVLESTALSEALTSVSESLCIDQEPVLSVNPHHVSQRGSLDVDHDRGVLSDLSSVDEDDQSLTESSSSTQSVSLDSVPALDLVSTIRQLVDMGYTRAEAKEMIVAFHRISPALIPDSPDIDKSLRVVPKIPSDRSLRRKANRDECRRLHLSAGLCYLAPVPFNLRKAMAQTLGKNPTIKAFVTELLPILSRLTLNDLYVVKVSNEALGTYHLSSSSHSAIGTFSGLLNGLRDRWQGDFYNLPVTEGHPSFYIPKGALIGSVVRQDYIPVPIAPALPAVVSPLYQPVPLKQQFADIVLDITDEVQFIDDLPVCMEVAYAILTRTFVRTKSVQHGGVFIKPMSQYVPRDKQIIVKDYSSKLHAVNSGYQSDRVLTLSEVGSSVFDSVTFILFADDIDLVSREVLTLLCCIQVDLDIMTNVIGSPLADLMMFSSSLSYNCVKHVVDMFSAVTESLPIRRMGHGPPGVITKVFLPRISDAAKSYIQRIDTGYEYSFDHPSSALYPVSEAFMTMRFCRIRDAFIARHYVFALADFYPVFRNFDESLARIIEQHFGSSNVAINA